MDPVQFARRSIRVTLRWASFASMLLITILSTVPGSLRPHTGYSGNLEHFLAYAGTAVLVRLGLPELRGVREVILLSAAAAIFEILQQWIPGRGPGIDNWAASTAGALIGMLVGSLFLHLLGARSVLENDASRIEYEADSRSGRSR